MVSTLKPTDSDYNAYYFGPANPVRYIGYGVRRTSETDMGGVERIRRETGLDVHSIEARPEDVRLAGPAPTDYLNEDAMYVFRRGVFEGKIIPTLEMFNVPRESRLNAAGEKGVPIGARPVGVRQGRD
jgi:hypothetical protein